MQRTALLSRNLWMLCLACLAAAAIASPARAATKVQSVEGITEYRLDNGLQVLLFPDNSKPTVTVNLTVFVGSRHEGYGETGMAHLLEHLLFKGTPTHTQIPKALQERGARYNGTTWVDRTNYYETLPATGDNLQFALELESDRLINSNVSRDDLLSEMTVVRNEFERGENMPTLLLYQGLLSTAYEWHNYGKSTIGNRTDIERVPIDRLKSFYSRFYQPDNAMLMVAGKFDEEATLEMIEKYFGAIEKPKRKLDRTYTEEPAQDGERSITLRRVGDVGLVGAVYHVPAGPHPDIAPLDILAGVLGNAPSGRLYKALVESHKATSIMADVEGWHDPGVFELVAEVSKGDSLDQAQNTMLEMAESIGKEKISDEEVERSRQKILKQRELNAANTGTIAVELSNWAAQGDWRLYFLYRDRIEKVTAADVQEVASRYLLRSNRTSGQFVPTEKPDRMTIPPTPDVEKLLADYRGREQVSSGETFDTSPENIDARTQRLSIGKNMKVALLPKKSRGETVHLRLHLRYGNLENLKKYRAAADILPPLMVRGSKELSREQVQDQLDKLRATFQASGEVGIAKFVLETKREHLPAVLEIVRQLLREPSLPEDEFEILKRQSLADLEEQMTDPQSLAIVRLRRTLNPYSKDDVRYMFSPEEEVAETKALTIDDLRQLYRNFLGATGELTIVGDFEAEPTMEIVRSMLADWAPKMPYERIPKVVFGNIKGSRQEILTPDKANAVFTGGQVFAINDTDPDYPALVLGNFIFGGSALSSRLGDRIRQKDGLSYGVGSFFAAEALDRRGSVTLFAIYNPSNLKKLEAAMREEIDRMLKDGVTSEEIEQGKKGYLQQEEVGRSSDNTLTSLLADTLYAGRTMQYYADFDKQLKAQTTETVLKALQKYLDPKRIAVVVAGDFKSGEKSADAEK